jgi:hypothetical protein
MRLWQKAVLTLVGLSTVSAPSVFFAYVAISHNPQNEYLSRSGAVQWSNLLPLLVVPTIVGAILAIVVVVFVAFLMRSMMKYYRERPLRCGAWTNLCQRLFEQ